MAEHFGIFCNSTWKKGQGSLFESINPATGEIVWKGYAATPSDVNETVLCAKKAFKTWSLLPIDERTHYLTSFAEILQTEKNSIAEAISQEMGKPLWDSRNEVDGMIAKVKITLEAYGSRCPKMLSETFLGTSITRHHPHGVIGVLGPFNFPGHLPNGHIVPALLAGNTVILKPSELAPLSTEKIFQCWEKARLPEGVINLVQGAHETGKALVGNENVNGIFFTGSYRVGKFLNETLGKDVGKILALEMGGNNPLIIGKISNFKYASFLTIQSAYLTSGQRCSCARRLIIPEGSEGDQFLQTLINMTLKIKIGPYNEVPEPYMGPVVSEKYALQFLEAQQNLKQLGGIPLIEMKQLIKGTGFLNPGLMDVTPIKNRPDEEIFCPFLQVIRVKDLNEAVEEANNTKYGLTAGILTDNEEEYSYFYNNIKAGVVNWNSQLTGASSAAPFGGVGYSGNFRPSGYLTVDYCSYPVASIENDKIKIPFQLPPGISLD